MRRSAPAPVTLIRPAMIAVEGLGRIGCDGSAGPVKFDLELSEQATIENAAITTRMCLRFMSISSVTIFYCEARGPRLS